MIVKFTLEFFRFVEKKFPLSFGFIEQSKKLSYATDVYRIIYGIPYSYAMLIQPPVDEDINSTLAYYTSLPLNLTMLEATLPDKKPFAENLIKIQYLRSGVQTFLTTSEAESFLNDVDKRITETLAKFFSDAKLNSFQTPKTTPVSSISSPEVLVDEPRVKAMLDLITYAEGTGADYGTVVRGEVYKSPFYPELVGQKDVVITNFSRHPQIDVIWRKGQPTSDAVNIPVLLPI